MQKPKPTMSLDADNLPAIKNWNVGETYTVTAKVKMTSMSEGDEYEFPTSEGEKRPMSARFKILSITPSKDAPAKKGKMLARVNKK